MLHRDYCYECGRPESWWSAFKHWLRWSRLGRWWKPYVPNPLYERYFNKKLLDAARNIEAFSAPSPFPEDAGKTVRFFKSDEGH